MHPNRPPRPGKSAWAALDARCEDLVRQLLLAYIRRAARKNGRPATPAASRPQH
jgi:hypothetical protein